MAKLGAVRIVTIPGCDQRDLHADAVTAMRGLAGEVLRLAGLGE